MNTTPTADYGRLFAALWVFVFLNMLLRDVHEALRPGFIQEVMTGSLNGTALTEELFLAAALVLQVPLVMIVLSHVLSALVTARVNALVGLLFGALVVVSDRSDMDDIVHAAAQLTALAVMLALWLRTELGRRRILASTAP